MAELEKFTDDAVGMLLKHVKRFLKNDSNKDIVEQKKDLNYAIPLDLNGLSNQQFYKKILDENYLYGRGTEREKKAITACSWVVTLPKTLSDYSKVGKDECIRLHPAEERAFFEGVTSFVQERYGNVFAAEVHYDEAKQPHVHIYFSPVTKLDHDMVQFKTIKTHHAVPTESGRYEFESKFVLDENGERIPLTNYAKMTDYYDTKISAADVLNKVELKHFHSDMMRYLKDNNIPGANGVLNGATSGKNIAVKDLKAFTNATGITLDSLRENPLPREELLTILQTANLSKSVQQNILALNADATINRLQERLSEKEQVIDKLSNELKEYQRQAERTQGWGSGTSSWGSRTITEERTW